MISLLTIAAYPLTLILFKFSFEAEFNSENELFMIKKMNNKNLYMFKIYKKQ